MRCLRRDLWIACFLILAGCDSRDGDRTGERKSFQALAQAYKQAHAHKDVEALLELVYVGSGPMAEVNTREFRARFTNDLQQDLKGIRRKRLTRDDRDAFRHPNLKPRGKLWIEWIPRDELTVKSFQGYRYGKHKGIYYIVATGPGAIEEELTDWIQGDHLTIKLPGVRQRAELALSRWRNETLDPEPILFWATHSVPGRGPARVALDLYDEDMDVVGFGVEQHHINTSGVDETYREEYPVFIHRPPWGCVIHTTGVLINVRDTSQRIDPNEWRRYVRGDDLHVDTPLSSEDWETTLPTVWVSRPRPDVVEVQIYLYDRAGHKSAPVPLRDPLQAK